MTLTSSPCDTLDGLTPIQLGLDVTFQLQLVWPVTNTRRRPPAAPKLNDVGDTLVGEDGQGVVGGSWLTATVRLVPIVTVPERVVEPVFSPTRTVIGPADTVDGVVIHSWLSITGHLQPLGPVTVTFCIPAADVKLNDIGDTLVGDGGQPTVTGMLRSPTVTVPDSPAWPERTVTVTRSPFDTLDGLTPIQLGLELTSQLQSLGPVTDTRPRPPAAPKLNDVGDTLVGEDGQGVVGGGDWLTATVRLTPIVTVPSRVVEPVFAPTLTVIGPADTVDGVVIHGWLSVTGQLQPLGPVTVTFRIPAADVKLNDVGDTLVGDGGQPTVTGMLRSPTVTVPDSPAWPERTVTVTRSPFDTLDGLTPIQLGLELTSQLQSLGPVTDTRPRPPAAPKLNDVGDTLVGEDGQGVVGGWLIATVRLVPIVTVPSRVVEPVFSPTLTVIGPAETVDGVVIHGWLSVTGQLQLLGSVTVTFRIPAADVKLNDVGDTLVGDGGQPTVTGMLRPPTVTVPDSPAWPEGTVTITLSPFDTLDGLTPIQLGLELTSQLQSLGPVTDTRPRPPAAPKLNDVGDTLVGEDGQGVVGGSWLTATVRLVPIVTVPERVVEPVFSPTRTVIGLADTVDGVVIHGWLSVTGHLQPLGSVTVTFRIPAADVKLNDVGDTLVGDGGQPTETGMLRPPIVTVPDSPAWPERTVTVTRSPFDTLDGLTPIQLGLELTVQLQPLSPVTDTPSVPPAAAKLNDIGDTTVGEDGH